jgi:hypothetical protein
MALKLNFSALSVSGAVDQHTGNLSVFENIEEIRVPQVPLHLPSLTLSLSLEKTSQGSEKGKLFIHMLTPDGKQALIGNGELAVPAEQRRVKALFRFGGMPIRQFGGHRIVVSWLNEQNVKEGEAIFDFDVVQSAQVAQAPAPAQTDPAQRPGGMAH